MHMKINERIARAVNGDVVTDSETDVDPEDLNDLHDVASQKGVNYTKTQNGNKIEG